MPRIMSELTPPCQRQQYAGDPIVTETPGGKVRRVIALCVLLAACHTPGASEEPQPVKIEVWEVANGTPCEAAVLISSYGGQPVQKLGTVPSGGTQSFYVMSTLLKGNAVWAVPLEADGTSLCQNNQNFMKKVVVRKVATQ
jgi:hypothetical protein